MATKQLYVIQSCGARVRVTSADPTTTDNIAHEVHQVLPQYEEKDLLLLLAGAAHLGDHRFSYDEVEVSPWTAPAYQFCIDLAKALLPRKDGPVQWAKWRIGQQDQIVWK